MNKDQKVLTGIAILAFIISACNASWEIRYEVDGKIKETQIVQSPIWEPPDSQPKNVGSDYQLANGRPYLMIAPLAGIWIGIGIIYTGLFFLLKETDFSDKILKEIKGRRIK